MRAAPEEIVTPSDCVLAIGVPLALEQYYRDMDLGSTKDFAKSIQRVSRLNENSLRNKIEEFIGLCKRNIRELQDLGVRVMEDFKIDDFSRISDYKVCAILSHFKPSRVLLSDIVHPEGILKRIAGDSNLFGNIASPLTKDLQKNNLSGFLVEQLNLLLNDAGFFRRAGVRSFLAEGEENLPEVYCQYLNRMAYENIFGLDIKKGNLVELSDNMYSIEKLLQALPQTTNQVIDLSICNSIILQDEIKRSNSNCLVLGVREPLSLNFKIIFFKGLMQKLRLQPKPYVSTYFELIGELKNKI